MSGPFNGPDRHDILQGIFTYVILLFIDVCDPIFRRWEMFCNFPQLSDAPVAAAAISLGFFRKRTPPENFESGSLSGGRVELLHESRLRVRVGRVVRDRDA